jgi:hypothetical protein
VLEQVQKFLDDGNRIHFELYPAEDHLVFATQDGFSSEIAQLGTTTRVTNPGHITYTWYPALNDAKLGLGPTGAYWVRGIAGRVTASLATIDVRSNALPNPVITTHQSHGANVPGDPTPALVEDQTWTLGPGPKPSRTLTATLTNVSTLGLDMARAKLPAGTLTVTTDGSTVLRLLALRPGTQVRWAGHKLLVGRDGTAVVSLAKGATRLTVH